MNCVLLVQVDSISDVSSIRRKTICPRVYYNLPKHGEAFPSKIETKRTADLDSFDAGRGSNEQVAATVKIQSLRKNGSVYCRVTGHDTLR